MSAPRMVVNEAWAISCAGLKLSGANAQAHKLTVEVSVPGSGIGPMETPGQSASVEIDADTWREIVRAVEGRLIQRGDPQR